MIAIIGVLFCLLTYFYLKRKDVFKFNWRKAVRFLVVNSLVTIALMGLLKFTPIKDAPLYTVTNGMTPNMIQMIRNTSVAEISLAGLEDAIFVLPLLVQPKIWLVRLFFTGVMTYVFMRGHDYQGTHAMLVKMPYVPIAYYFASRYGILTTIVAHAFNDVWALTVLKTRLWLEEKYGW